MPVLWHTCGAVVCLPLYYFWPFGSNRDGLDSFHPALVRSEGKTISMNYLSEPRVSLHCHLYKGLNKGSHILILVDGNEKI